MKPFLKMLARWRTWVVNVILVFATMAPEVFNSPEILAIVPQEYQRYFLAFLFVVNIWMRPRPAVLPSDPEVKNAKLA